MLGYPCILYLYLLSMDIREPLPNTLVRKSAVNRTLVRFATGLAMLGYPCMFLIIFTANSIGYVIRFLVYKPFSFLGCITT